MSVLRVDSMTIARLEQQALASEANALLCRAGRGLGGPAAAPGYEREAKRCRAEVARRMAAARALRARKGDD